MLVNSLLIDKYYIYEKNKILERVSRELQENTVTDELITKLLDNNEVIIVSTAITDSIEDINESLIFSFEKNKIKLNKFWLTEETLASLDYKTVTKVYDQGASKYTVLTKFIKINNNIYAIGMPLPYMYETIEIVNKFNIFITFISISVILIIVSILSNKIARPIEDLKALSRDIANLNFTKIDINTNDEIEDLANSINIMSGKLEKAHNEISTQNKRLKGLLSDVSHELKTPLALIKVYSQGIQDGLDDGTYLNIISDQVERMNLLIEKLLFWAKLDNTEINKSTFDLNSLIEDVINKYKLILDQNNIKLTDNLKTLGIVSLYADREMIKIVLDNLFTNSIKYTYDNTIKLSLERLNGGVIFKISNRVKEDSLKNLNNIWTPFYVVEKSRNKNLSGTGLGLSIVKGILENHKFSYGHNVAGNEIEFFIEFKDNL